jgi:putative pyruvate formate lyase activating enzyme
MTAWPENIDTFSKPVRRLWQMMNPCTLCPQSCRVDRPAGELGFCNSPAIPKVCSVGPHFGEEPCLVGSGGSGTIFFAGCNLRCIFCQNYDISQHVIGRDCHVERLTEHMLSLQTAGCSNINLVTPSHLTAPIAAAIESARKQGLSLPIVYNSGGYDSPEVIDLLDGFIDIYMPDMKYADPEIGHQLSSAKDYPRINQTAVWKMHGQAGNLKTENGIAKKGLLVRHLVLPNNLAGSQKIIDFLADEISPHTAINVMAQYRPCYHASTDSRINRRPTTEEIDTAVQYARTRNLRLIG